MNLENVQKQKYIHCGVQLRKIIAHVFLLIAEPSLFQVLSGTAVILACSRWLIALSYLFFCPLLLFSLQLKISVILFDRHVYPSSGWNSLAIIKRLLDQEGKKKKDYVKSD